MAKFTTVLKILAVTDGSTGTTQAATGNTPHTYCHCCTGCSHVVIKHGFFAVCGESWSGSIQHHKYSEISPRDTVLWPHRYIKWQQPANNPPAEHPGQHASSTKSRHFYVCYYYKVRGSLQTQVTLLQHPLLGKFHAGHSLLYQISACCVSLASHK